MHPEDRLPNPEPRDQVNQEELARRQAIRQIERRRRFRVEMVSSGIGMLLLVAVWATSEYHNAGGWPTQGFSESSGIPNVWNFWIVYPLIAWVLYLAARAWSVYGNRPISDEEIRREMERQSGTRRR